MSSISFRLNKEDAKLVQDYVSINNLNLSSFIRELLLDKIEEDLILDDDRLLKARDLAKQGKVYSIHDAFALFEET
ncbi:MAG: DUF6290 family protein [Gallicola sp.]|nr:DUF6290 family protein [Gallicola sp.]